jgi:hypothetical protein
MGKMGGKYVPGRCNIGVRGRVMRASTGAIVIGVALWVGLFGLAGRLAALRLVLVPPFYVGLLAVLEAGMSFCVLHASRGTYDFHEKIGPVGRSTSRAVVEMDEWKRMDRRKARIMYVEALAGAVLLTLVLSLV